MGVTKEKGSIMENFFYAGGIIGVHCGRFNLNLKLILKIFLIILFLAPPTFAEIKIQPLGDSITENAPTKSYRYYLWFLLKNNGYNVDFVGSKQTQKFPDFDPDHDGRSGWRADQIAASLNGWLKSYAPNIVLLHIGHNDFFQGESVDNVVSDIKKIIDILQAKNPDVTILLAKLIPAKSSGLKRTQLNARIPDIASAKSTVRSKVYVVDHTDGYVPETDNYDCCHPNENGNKKMAQKWYNAILSILPPNSGSTTLLIAPRSLKANVEK
jgi:acyl-CoA thioesterase I